MLRILASLTEDKISNKERIEAKSFWFDMKETPLKSNGLKYAALRTSGIDFHERDNEKN